MPASRTKFYLDKDNKKLGGRVRRHCGLYRGRRDAGAHCDGVTDVRHRLCHPGLYNRGLAGAGEAARVVPGSGRCPVLAGRQVQSGGRSAGEVRAKLRDIDRRMADIETLYTSRNTQLANEIDSLR